MKAFTLANGEKLSAGDRGKRVNSLDPRKSNDNVTNHSPLTTHHSLRKRVAFTLAEVLIVLGVIGVVAAITIPALITKINQKVVSVKKTVMEKKLLEGLNQFSNRENGLSVEYNNTEEFVRGLSKYLKIVTICSNTELNKCFPYEKINYDADDGAKSVNLTSITTAKKLRLRGNWLDPAGIVLADGTPIILSYNNDCVANIVVDPDRPLKDIPTSCIDGLYDNNGSKIPNKFGKDIQSLGLARFKCLIDAGNVCFESTPVVPTPITYAECYANKSKYGIKGCYFANDYWAGAMKMCQDQGMHLAKDEELTNLASYLYNTTVAPTDTTNAILDTSKIPDSMSGLGTSWFYLWSNYEQTVDRGYYREFRSNATMHPTWSNAYRKNSDLRAICVSD